MGNDGIVRFRLCAQAAHEFSLAHVAKRRKPDLQAFWVDWDQFVKTDGGEVAAGGVGQPLNLSPRERHAIQAFAMAELGYDGRLSKDAKPRPLWRKSAEEEEARE